MKANYFGPMGLPTNEYDPSTGRITGTYPPFDHEDESVVIRGYDPSGRAMVEFAGAAGEGVKHDQAKPDYTLLPLKTLEGVVRVMEFGVKKYARDDWKRLPDGYNRYLAAHLRHMAEVLEDPYHVDYESGLLSYDHALCDLIFARRFLNEAE